MKFCSSEPVSFPILGEVHQFYPVSFKMLGRLRSIGKPLVTSIAAFFSKRNTDVATKSQNIVNDDGSAMTTIENDAIPTDLAKLRSDQLRAELSSLCEELLSDTNRRILCEMIIDSLRDAYPRDVPAQQRLKDLEKMDSEIDLAFIIDAIQGIFAANKKIFSPLMSQLPKGAVDAAKRAFKIVGSENTTPEESSTQTPKTGEGS